MSTIVREWFVVFNMIENNNNSNTINTNTQDIVLDMLQRNIEIKMIMQATGLSEYEIKKIKYSI